MYHNSSVRKSFGRSYGHSRPTGASFNPNRFRGPRKSGGENIDPAKFVNKAVAATPEEKYVSTNSFRDFGLHERLLTNVIAKGYLDPMPIQDQTIPHVMTGKDVIGLANTGTGKTAAFLLPLIHKTMLAPGNTKTLIIAPTRELAEQIRAELFDYTKSLGIYSALVIGGANIRRQIYDLERNPHFVIGTPGRLKDLNERRAINFNRYNNIVLDEVDRMFDMGFSREIQAIMKQLPEDRQSLFFSATINNEVDSLIRQNSKEAVKISLVRRETTATVDQDVIKYYDQTRKLDTLHDLLKQESFERILIFGRTKMGVNRLAIQLQDRGFKTESIHGNKSQPQRQRALSAFKQGRVNILVATDVAARGLDIPDISHVINYDLPENYSDYIHRIGRAGRAGKMGKALTFVR
jgi:superfamily II DNA/RNA helicase